MLLVCRQREGTSARAALIAAAIAAWAPPAYSEGGYNTATAFFEEYQDGENVMARLYIRGVYDGLGMSNALSRKEHGAPSYCTLEKVALVDAQYVAMMKDFVAKQPNAAKFPPAAVLLFTIRDAFPCQ